MKRIFFAAAIVAALASCTDDHSEFINPRPENGPIVSVDFAADPEALPASKAFFDATTETWEKTLNNVAVLVFDNSGTLLVQRNFTASELSAKKSTFAIPSATVGTACEFYAVANMAVEGIEDKATLLAKLESSAAEYNGTFAEVTTKAKRTGGFVMSGSATKTIAAAGTRTDVTITLKRTVAKIALQVSMSADFSDKYKGAVRINSAKLSKAASQSLVIKAAAPSTGTMNYTHTQASNASGATYQNLFYIFENGALAAGSRVLLELSATYDSDGNFSSTGDQATITYMIELDGKAGGLIERNGYYKIDAMISGLVGSSASVTVSVADWESPITQTVNIGQ